MKCPKCGFTTSDSKDHCQKCGFLLHGPSPSSVATEVPPWRKEISQKVRAYGERKKKLITPPHAIKENPDSVQSSASVPEPDVPAPIPQPLASRERNPAPQPMSASPRIEIWNEDLEEIDLDEEHPRVPSRYIGSRAAALLIDSTIIIVVCLALTYCAARLTDYDLGDFLLNSLRTLVELFALFHFSYYAYFYKTSRQTPGQVFFALELRDPASSSIPLKKIVIRWLVMILLNILNLLPLLAKEKPLLLDQLSGTEIRSLKL